eukprot:7044132-Lingulodinium_polyedra.AAC.1
MSLAGPRVGNAGPGWGDLSNSREGRPAGPQGGVFWPFPGGFQARARRQVGVAGVPVCPGRPSAWPPW